MRLENFLVACDWYGLFSQSDKFSVWKVEEFLSLFGLKEFPFSLFLSVILVL